MSTLVTPDSSLVTPGSVPVSGKQADYYNAFIAVLIILLLLVVVVIVALIKYILYRRRARKRASTAETSKPITNGLSPSKKKKYRVNGKDDSLLAAESRVATENSEDKTPPSPKIEHDVHYASNGQDNIELGLKS